MDPIKLQFNKTTTFLLPIMFPNNTHDEFFSNYFKQAYIGLLDDEYDVEPRLVLEFSEDTDELDLTLFSLDFGTGINKTIADNIISYEIPEDILPNYYNIVNGEYSKLNEDFKDIILDFWGEDEDSLLNAILHNDKPKIEEFKPYLDREIVHELEGLGSECWPPPNIISEELLVT